MLPPRLLLFDPYSGGHHAEHVRHLMRAWRERDVAGALRAVVTPALAAEHPDLRTLTFEEGDRAAALEELPEAEPLARPGVSLIEVGLRHRALLRDLVARHRPDHVLLMYLDHAQLALAMGLRLPSPTRVSGILFRPSFHYARFDATPVPLKEQARRLRKRLLLSLALRNPHVHATFTLDPTAIPAIRALVPGSRAVALPDPVTPEPPAEPPAIVRAACGVASNRLMVLLFGALEERKGVLQLLDAFLLLPEPVARRYSVLLSGRVAPALKGPLAERLGALAGGPAQVIVSDAFVPDHRLQTLLHAADLVLAPYQRHIGSSGVLIRAAAAGRPVLSQDYGLMGHQVREHRLGLVTDTTSPRALADALAAFAATGAPAFDPARAQAFAARNTVAAYLDVIFAGLFG